MNRAYSILTAKAVEEDGKRIVRGMATTPAVDRVGDVIDPMGVKFESALPFLWQHRHDQPIGWVKFGKPTKKGIPFEAEVASVEEEGELKAFIDKCWQTLKLGLVRAVSIGFRAIKWAWIGEYEGIEYQEIEVFELSAVTIPANQEALITEVSDAKGVERVLSVVKSFDEGVPAVSGRPTPPRKDPARARATPETPRERRSPVNLTPKEGTDMKTLAEQIAALEAKRAANAARMEEVLQKSIDEGRSTDEAEQEEFDTLEAEQEAIDGDLKRLKSLEAMKAKSAKPVDPAVIRTPDDGSDARNPARAEIRLKKAELPGVRLARLAKVRSVSRLDNEPAVQVAERMYGADSEVVAILKAPVVAGSTADGNWGAGLVGAEGSAFADFVAFLRPATILGKFGEGSIPGLRKVPFREPLISQTGGGAAYWVGEGKPKPLTAFNFARTTIQPLKIANIAVLTEENVRSSNPSSELIVRDALRDALAAGMDVAFIDPINEGDPGVKPASITYGAAAIATSGPDADDIRLDVRAVFQKFIAADNPPESGVWIMSTTNALALSLMVNALGQREFPGISMTGGTFEGMPVIASRYAGTNVALVNASDIYEADEGGVMVDMSREASLEMLNSDLVQDATAGTGASMVSLWQSNLVGLRAERIINWMRRRTSAVAYLTGVAWGGAVPAS